MLLLLFFYTNILKLVDENGLLMLYYCNITPEYTIYAEICSFIYHTAKSKSISAPKSASASTVETVSDFEGT